MLPIAALTAIISVAVFSGGHPFAQGRPNTASAPPDDVEVLPIRPDFHMIAGAGGNIAVQVGSDGVVLVDTGSAATADAVVVHLSLLARLRSQTVAHRWPTEERNGE